MAPALDITILGSGPAGLSAALFLARDKGAKVTVLERSQTVGGNAGSFLLEDVWCDFGSHRFHPAAEPHVLGEVQSLLGEDLLWRPRHGRIRLKGRWIHFPLQPADLLLSLPKDFAAGLMLDAGLKLWRKRRMEGNSFASILERDLGPTMSHSFYFPYVRKLWGIAPDELATTLAKRRVSGSSISKIIGKIMRRVLGLSKETSGGFYYPRKGFGAISSALHREAARHGANFVFGADVSGILHDGKRVTAVRYQRGDVGHTVPVSAIWSSLPISLVIKRMDPPAPKEITEFANRIRFRGMILIYLVLQQRQFSPYDAYYFPELTIPISRMSEPKNYSATSNPPDRTILCAELPCDPGEPYWLLSDEELGKGLCEWLEAVNLSVTAPVVRTVTRRLNFAYPIYERGFEKWFDAMDVWLSTIDRLLTFGRQGLFAHDNTHHAIAMGHAAASCTQPDGTFNAELWAQFRREFEKHVVED